MKWGLGHINPTTTPRGKIWGLGRAGGGDRLQAMKAQRSEAAVSEPPGIFYGCQVGVGVRTLEAGEWQGHIPVPEGERGPGSGREQLL